MAEIPERIACAREPRRLPAVLSADAVVRFLEAVPSLKARAARTTAYAAGLRVSEVTNLQGRRHRQRPDDYPPRARQGGKERCAMLSAQLLSILRTYGRLARPGPWPFPGGDADRPIEPTTLHAACRSARAAAGIDKTGTVRILRHSFAPICWRAASTSG